MRELSVTECHALLGSAQPPQFLDVREPWEVETAAVAGAVNIPMGQVPTRLRLFDQATARQRTREKATRAAPARGRGWTREELYQRGRHR